MTTQPLSAIAAYELRNQLLTPAGPLIAFFLAAYNVIYSSQSESLAELGAADVAHNSHYVVYLFSVGTCFWLMFLLAHMASVPITRDISRRFAEVALTFPISFRVVLLGKFLGATAAALILAMSIPLSWIATSWILPPDIVVPTPWLAMGHVYVLFVVPTVIFTMGVYFAVAAYSGRAAPAYAMAFALLVLWMLGVTVLWEGGVDRVAAQWIDPIGWVTVLAQVEQWTAAERDAGIFELTREVLVNRTLAIGLGLAAVGLAVIFSRPQRWLLGPQSRRPASRGKAPREARPIPRGSLAIETSFGARARLYVVGSTSARLLWWQLNSGGARLLLGFVFLSMLGGGWAHVLHGVDGMRLPWTGFTLPRLSEIVFLPTALYLCFAASQLVFKERHDRFSELLDTMPIPRWSMAAPRILALIGLASAFAFLPALGTIVLQAVFAPSTTDLVTPWILSAVLIWPAFIEIGAITILVYVCVQREWLAHGLAFFVIFALIVNHEIGVVENPVFQYGIPLPVEISQVTGTDPWLRAASAVAGVHLSAAIVFFFASMLLWPRGFSFGVKSRMRTLLSDTTWPHATFAALLLFAVLLSGIALTTALDGAGEIESRQEERAHRAEYERRFRSTAVPWELATLEATLELYPSERRVDVRGTVFLVNPRSHDVDRIDLDLPEDFELLSASVDGAHVASWDRHPDLRHDVLRLDAPSSPGAIVRLHFHGRIQHAAVRHSALPFAIGPSGVWATATSLLPDFGYDRERELTSPVERASHGLEPRALLTDDLSRATYGLRSKRATHSIRVVAPEDHVVLVSGASGLSEGTASVEADGGPIDFAIAAAPKTGVVHQVLANHVAVHVLAHVTHREQVPSVLDRAAQSLAHLERRLGDSDLSSLWVVQTPRETVPLGIHGNILMLPDEAAWDYDLREERFDSPLFHISSALSRRWFLHRIQPPLVPGHAALTEGLSLTSALDVLASARAPSIAAAHNDEIERNVLREIASASAPLAAPIAADSVLEGNVAGLALHGLRHRAPEAFDRAIAALIRGDIPSSMTSLAQSLGAVDASPLQAITAIDARIVSATYHAAENRVLVESQVQALTYEDGMWRPQETAPVVPIVVETREGQALAEDHVATGRHEITVGPTPETVELDPQRAFIDRNRRDNRRVVATANE